MQRPVWSSQIAYILTVAGATIGFGATWRFPYLVGQNGGGAYVLTFCIAMIVIGIPMILVENAIGRRMHKNSLDCFGGSSNGKPISRLWKIVGVTGLIGAFGIMAYYMVIGGWVLNYIYHSTLGNLSASQELNADITKEFYQNNVVNSPIAISIATFLFVLVNYIVLTRGVINGIERAAKILMPLLFLIMIGMVLRNITLSGAMEGIKYYLTPDFSKITPQLFVAVLGQVFFALSLGFGVMITLSSHLHKKEQLVKTSVITGIVNTLIAVIAGFMIFPSLFTFGISPNAGPSLVFESLPIVFSKMHGGTFFMVAFFCLLMLAAFTTSMPNFQVLIVVLEEKFGINKKLAVFAVLGVIFLLGNIPSILGDNIWKDVRIFGKSIFDAFDDISATIFFILTSLGCALFVGWVLKDEAKKEILNGSEKYSKVVDIWFLYVKYIIPFIILIIFISSFYSSFLK
ncbi:sodium-dependent transporter [Helicobacter muridarum]|uniref:Transporter n=1 Tax=Helicobacter muridarum TaxID=216 RepID=A0A099TXW2_9HELI|nr:sodium-dependent transporter [Helicobacter muridarum]TLE00737.1 sodium-dependent transporter [Helicobacter muridarum]STQ86585.1 sodium-dependent transmembrane transport protein [Helicobacter muridarum]